MKVSNETEGVHWIDPNLQSLLADYNKKAEEEAKKFRTKEEKEILEKRNEELKKKTEEVENLRKDMELRQQRIEEEKKEEEEIDREAKRLFPELAKEDEGNLLFKRQVSTPMIYDYLVKEETEDERYEREEREEAERERLRMERAINLAQALAEKERGNKRYREKRFVEAIKCYTRAIKYIPTGTFCFLCNTKDMVYYNNRAAAYFEMGLYKDCIADTKIAVHVGRQNRGTHDDIAK